MYHEGHRRAEQAEISTFNFTVARLDDIPQKLRSLVKYRVFYSFCILIVVFARPTWCTGEARETARVLNLIVTLQR